MALLLLYGSYTHTSIIYTHTGPVVSDNTTTSHIDEILSPPTRIVIYTLAFLVVATLMVVSIGCLVVVICRSRR